VKKTRKKTAKINSNINLALSETNQNYWSPLTCLVEEQEKMKEERARPIATARSESEREMQIFLKRNGQVAKKKHWTEVWNKNSDDEWFRTEESHIPLAKPYSKPVEKALTEVLATPTPAHTTQPPTIDVIEEEDINQEVIHHVAEIEDKFEKLLSEINELCQATEEKIWKAEENDAAQDIVEMGPFGYLDSACTSGVVTEEDQKYLVDTGEISTKEFTCPQGDIAKATKKMELDLDMRQVALEMNVVPGLESTLVSVCKMAEADYITVLDKNEAKIYDGKTVKITVSEEAVLKGWRCKRTGLWRVPLQRTVVNENTDTLIIDRPDPKEAIAHYFELPSTEKNDSILPCMRGIPSKIYLDSSNQSRKLLHVARFERQGSRKILP
jgi:hypothetical protein